MSYRGDGPPPPAHPTTDPWTGANYQAYAPSYGYHYGPSLAYGYDPRYYGPPQTAAPAQTRHYYCDDRPHAARSRSRSAPRQRSHSSDRQTRKEMSKSYKSSSAKSSSRSRSRSRSRDKRYITKYERSDSSNTSRSGRFRRNSRDSPRRSASRDSCSVESDKYRKHKKPRTPERIRKRKVSKKYKKSLSPDDRISQPKIKQEKKSGKTLKAHHSKRSSVTPPKTYQGRETSITPPKSYMKCRSVSHSSHESRSHSKHRKSHSTSRSRSGTRKHARTRSSSSSSSSKSASDGSSSSSRSKSRSVSPIRKRRHHSPSSNSSHRRHKSHSRSAHSGSQSGSDSSSEDARRGQFTVADRKRYWKLHKNRQDRRPVEPTKEIKPPPGAVENVTADDVMYGDPPEMEGPNFAELLTHDSAGMPSTSKGKAPIPIRNDGSFLEMFKKMQENNKKETDEQKPVIKKPVLPFIGKRRGGKVLKTGLVKKAKAIDEQPADDKPKDAWSLYMQEVKKYRETSCEEERKTRPLVK